MAKDRRLTRLCRYPLILSLLLSPSILHAQTDNPSKKPASAAKAGAKGTSAPSSLNQLPPAQRDEFARHAASARKHYESGSYFAAIEELRAAYAIFPAPQIHFRLGQAASAAKRPVEAINYYQAYLRAVPKSNMRSDIEAKIAKLKQMAKVRSAAKVRIESLPAGAKVINLETEEVLGETPLELTIAAGRYSIRLEKEGYQDQDVNLSLQPREKLVQSFQMVAKKKEIKPVAQDPRVDDAGGGPSTTSVVLMGVGGAALVTAGVFYAVAGSRWGTIQEMDEQRPGPRPPEYDNTSKRLNNALLLGHIGAGVAAITLTTGLILWATQEPGSHAPEEKEAGVASAFNIIWTGDVVGLGLSGRF